jgi:hypothetical protein
VPWGIIQWNALPGSIFGKNDYYNVAPDVEIKDASSLLVDQIETSVSIWLLDMSGAEIKFDPLGNKAVPTQFGASIHHPYLLANADSLLPDG